MFHLLYKERRSLLRRTGDLDRPSWISLVSLRMTFIGSRSFLLLRSVLG